MSHRISAATAVLAAASIASAQNPVTGGQTSVLLDLATLESAAGLTLSDSSGDVIAPGNLGDDSVAFPILDSSTFDYATGFTTFSGEILHEGELTFNGTTTVGDFAIGFDADLAETDGLSGFFVESTTTLLFDAGDEEDPEDDELTDAGDLVLFNIGDPTTLTAEPGNLVIGADIFLSDAFAAFLGDSTLSGELVGSALVEAVPTPGAAAAVGLAGLALARRRR